VHPPIRRSSSTSFKPLLLGGDIEESFLDGVSSDFTLVGLKAAAGQVGLYTQEYSLIFTVPSSLPCTSKLPLTPTASSYDPDGRSSFRLYPSLQV
jgi:hypothetical protein